MVFLGAPPTPHKGAVGDEIALPGAIFSPRRGASGPSMRALRGAPRPQGRGFALAEAVDLASPGA